MMGERKDLRSNIIPTTIGDFGVYFLREETTDNVYIESSEEVRGPSKKSATDYARLNGVREGKGYVTKTGKPSVGLWTRTSSSISDGNVDVIHDDGSTRGVFQHLENIGVCPCLHYKLPDEMEKSEIDIREVKGTDGEILYHTLHIGEYSKTEVDEKTLETLEALYNGGKKKEGITPTGRWNSGNGEIGYYAHEDAHDIEVNKRCYKGKHNPEFEYQGERYVRVRIITDEWVGDEYIDNTVYGYKPSVTWVKVEPISFIIENWDEMPKWINPEGTGEAKYFDLVAEEAIIGGIPFYPNNYERYGNLWQNSCWRGFLNGIDVRNITENGNPEYGTARGGNFTGECNFLNEAFNLSREPMIEYTIPDSELRIPDDAFNGCITLKKLVIHSGIKSIGQRAFDGLDFKYAYRTENGELILSQELPQNKDEYVKVIDLDELEKTLIGFDYEILVASDNLDEICDYLEILNNKGFSIPNEYALALAKSGKLKAFCEKSDFEFFKDEFPNIDEMILNYSKEARLNIFKFAANIGCFSTKKILDEQGNETQEYLAQKASSLLAQILETQQMYFSDCGELYNLMPFDAEPNQEFLEFISIPQNLEMILELQETYPNVFTKVMTNFNDVKPYRECFDGNGMPKDVSWEDALEQFIQETNEYTELAKLLEDNEDMPEEAFSILSDLRQQAADNNIPEHILGKPISDTLKSIEAIKKETEDVLISAGQMVRELSDDLFTYEWLSKNDPANSLLALVWECVDSVDGLESFRYSADRASVFAPDVQNLVIRDAMEDIVARATVYVNKDRGYAVINGCKIKEENQEQDEEIFKAFKSGVRAFVDEYDRQNPNKPLQQINLGSGIGANDDLWMLMHKGKFKAQKGKLLDVPYEYGFTTAMAGQWVLYKRQETNDRGGDDR